MNQSQSVENIFSTNDFALERIFSILSLWSEGKKETSPLEDYNQVVNLILSITDPGILKNQKLKNTVINLVKESPEQVLRLRSLWLIEKMTSLGFSFALGEWVEISVACMIDEYDKVLSAFSDLIKGKNFPKDIKIHLASELKEHLSNVEAFGGTNKDVEEMREYFTSLKKELGSSLARLKKKEKSLLKKMEESVPKGSAASTERAKLLRSQIQSKKDLIKEGFPDHFPELRGKILRLEGKVKNVRKWQRFNARFTRFFS